jgi:hypothetical protein
VSAIRTFAHLGGQTQRLAVGDLLLDAGAAFRALLSAPVSVVYSDPPWNPGNEKWWRRHAGAEPPTDYAHLLDAWCACVAAAQPQHVLVEQSVNLRHKGLLLEAVGRCHGWGLPLIEEWVVQYGSPLRPNALLHFGRVPLATDPSGMRDEAMTRRVFEGLQPAPGGTVADPCMGLGTTSRMAHEFGQHCIGTELCGRRLDVTIRWLLRHGYAEVSR